MKRHLQIRFLRGARRPTGSAIPLSWSADNVHGSDPSQMSRWQGRAGGLVHSDRIARLRAPNPSSAVAISYDKDVAERTNMLRGEVAAGRLSVTYDKDVARRTNMPRDEQDTQTAQAAAQK